MSRFSRITVWLSIRASSRSCLNLPKPPSFTNRAKYVSDSARRKLSTVTRTGFPSSADAVVKRPTPIRIVAAIPIVPARIVSSLATI